MLARQARRAWWPRDHQARRNVLLLSPADSRDEGCGPGAKQEQRGWFRHCCCRGERERVEARKGRSHRGRRAVREVYRDEVARARHIADFIAGMTDRYALAEHARLFDSTPELR